MSDKQNPSAHDEQRVMRATVANRIVSGAGLATILALITLVPIDSIFSAVVVMVIIAATFLMLYLSHMNLLKIEQREKEKESELLELARKEEIRQMNEVIREGIREGVRQAISEIRLMDGANETAKIKSDELNSLEDQDTDRNNLSE